MNRVRTYHCKNRNWTLHHGEAMNVLRGLPSNTYDAVLTRPNCGFSAFVEQELNRVCRRRFQLVSRDEFLTSIKHRSSEGTNPTANRNSPVRSARRRLLIPFSIGSGDMTAALNADWDHVTGIFEPSSNTVSATLCELASFNKRVHSVPRTPVPNNSRLDLPPNSVSEGDCNDLIHQLLDNSIDLVFTSPPYGNQRQGLYRGVNDADYPEFTLRWMEALKPKLTERGSVLINIRPDLKKGQIKDYVLKTRLALREDGWIECEEIIWYKPDGGGCMGSHQRPRRTYEKILWFSKTNKPFENMKACGRVVKIMSGRPVKAGVFDSVRIAKHPVRTKLADVIRVPVTKVERGINHPARFPVELAEIIVKSFCPEGGTVLDNFAGSGSERASMPKILADNFMALNLRQSIARSPPID